MRRFFSVQNLRIASTFFKYIHQFERTRTRARKHNIMLSKRFAVLTAIGALAGTASHASPARQLSSSGCSGLPVVEWAVEIADIANADERTALCSDHHVLCGADSIVAKFDAGDTTLSYDDSNNWQVKSGDTVVLTAEGYKFDSIDYTLKGTTTVADTQLVDLEALDTQLNADAGVTNCDSTFQAAVDAYTALQVPCAEVGNVKFDQKGACETSTASDTRCVVGYEYSTADEKCKVKLAYVEPEESDAATQAQHKRNHFKSIRKGGVVQRGSETDAVFEKRKFAQMKINTREYFKQKMEVKISQNTDLNKKKHQMRKEERMPVSVAADSDDFKPALRDKLRTKFGLGSGQDRDVGIIVGPDNSGDPEDCANWVLADTFDDADKCITYDAAIDGDTTDVHVLGADGAYNVGGILVGDKYVPVVKQTLANANAEMYEMSCWSGSAWEQQHKVEMVADIYVKFTKQDDDNFYNFYTDSSCTTGQIVKSDGKYHLKPQQYTFHRCAGDSGHNFDADLVTNTNGEFTGIAVGDTETLVVTSGNDFVWQCAQHPNSMNGIFTGAGWEAGDEVPCTVKKSGIVVKVDTIVGSSVTGQVDGDKCDEGFGCEDANDDGVCDTLLTCVACTVPDANNAIDASVCEAQLCEAGKGYNAASVSFDHSLDPTDTANANCGACDDGTYNTGVNGQCVAYGTDTTCSNGYALDTNHDSKIADAECVDVEGPTITSGSTATAIDENSGAGPVVYTATATDNSNGAITFSLSGTDATKFTINANSGEVTLTADPNYETQTQYSFTVVATDAAGNSATQAVTLAINNVDEVAPTITSGDTANDILEGTGAGQVVYTASADDSVETSTPITFSLGGSDANAFSIDQSSGKVTLVDSLSPEDYSFTVTATDAAGNEATKTVSLTVSPDADGDGTHDVTDTCVYTGCTVQQLTDAYALLTSADACSGSRRTHTHANIDGCKTAGCASEVDEIKAAFDNLHTVCSA